MKIDSRKHKIHFAPLQGYTDWVYRKVYYEVIGGVDYYYTPYLSVDRGIIKSEDITMIDDVIISYTIPQLLPSNVAELKLLLQHIESFKFKNININLGCPYPMVTRKGRGSALINKPVIVIDLIKYIKTHTDYKVSLKVRSGMENNSELFNLFDSIPLELLSEIIVHPRTAIQLYKGIPTIDIFKQCTEMFPDIKFVYNGDIFSCVDFNEKLEILPEQSEWMLGRGLLSNPFLSWQINGCEPDLELLQEFVIRLVNDIELYSSDRGHALNRIKIQFEALLGRNERKRKLLKRIKKAKNIDEVKSLLESF